MRQVGLLGGTFDPPTLSHIAVAERAKEALGLDEVWLVPSVGTHKTPQVDGELRAAMCELAVLGLDGLEVNTVDLENGFSHSVDTLGALVGLYPDVHFTFLVGDDIDLSSWKDFSRCEELARFVRVAREGVEPTLDDLLRVELDAGAHSSSVVREQLGGGVCAGVSTTVADFITSHQLYSYCPAG